MKAGMLILGVLVGLTVGWFLWHTEEPDGESGEKPHVEKKDPVVKDRGIWPDVPCPPGEQSGTARQKLNAIIDMAMQAQQWQAVALAQQCLWLHANAPSHQGQGAAAMSQKVAAAHAAAEGGNWGECVNELDHDQ